MKIRNLFDSLRGMWTLERTFKDFSGALIGSVVGMARFSPKTDDVLHYQEEGELTDALGKKLQVHREYLYCYQKETDAIEIHFSEDGYDRGLFYQLKFQATDVREKSFNSSQTVEIANGEHLCSRDLYEAKHRYYLSSQSILRRLELEYRVSGPEKSYIAQTILHR